jgi:hypothetical protein
MITAKDRQILRHIEEYSFITLEQARLIAFPDMRRGYEYVRTRIQRLCKVERRLKVIHNTALKLNLYVDIDADVKKIPNSPHRIYLMDFYCKLTASGCNIDKFDLEKQWMDGKYRSDALCIYEYGGYKFRNLIEVNKSNNTLDLDRFDIVKDEIIKSCEGFVPRLILIDDRTHKDYSTKVYQVIRLDYSLKNFSEIFL